MKNIIEGVTLGSFLFLLFYALVSIDQVSFNIGEWTEQARLVFSLLGGLFCIGIGAMVSMRKKLNP